MLNFINSNILEEDSSCLISIIPKKESFLRRSFTFKNDFYSKKIESEKKRVKILLKTLITIFFTIPNYINTLYFLSIFFKWIEIPFKKNENCLNCSPKLKVLVLLMNLLNCLNMTFFSFYLFSILFKVFLKRKKNVKIISYLILSESSIFFLRSILVFF